MSRETKLERLERENRDLRDEVASCRAWVKSTKADRDRLEARCGWLYKEAQAYGAEVVKLRLAAGFMSHESFAAESKFPPSNLAPREIIA